MIYILILILLILLSYHYDFKGNTKNWNLWYYLILIVFISLAGFRYRLGGDTINYMDWFENLPTFNNFFFDLGGYEIGFTFIAVFAKSVGNFYLLQIIVAAIFNISFFSFLRKNSSKHFFMCLLLYFFLYYYFICYEVMRASIAIAIFLYSVPYLLKGKYLKYYICCLIAFLFHYSSIFLWILPFCKTFRLNKYTILLLLFALMAYELINSLFLNSFYLFALNPRLTYLVEWYTTNARYSVAGGLNFKGYISQCFAPILVSLLSLWYFKKWSGSRFRYEYFIVLMIFTQALVIGIPIFYRFADYLFPFSVICIAEVLFLTMKKLKPNINRFFYILLLIVVPYFIFYFLAIYNHKMYGDYQKYYMFYPYNCILNEGTCQEREMIYQIGL